MKHHCHCGLGSQLKKLKAGKLGVFGGVLIIGHLLFHVVECLALPTILMALRGNTAEATTTQQEIDIEISAPRIYTNCADLRLDFQDTLNKYDLEFSVGKARLDFNT